MQYFFLCIFSVFIAGCTTPPSKTTEENSKNTQEQQPISIIAFGDSLTEGYGLKTPEKDSYPAQLQEKLTKNGFLVHIENAGISGETSTGALSRANWIAESNPDIILLFSGANDMLRGISPETVEKNIASIVDIFTQKNIQILMLPMEAQTGLGEEYQKKFNALYLDIAQEKNIPLTPFPLKNIAFKAEYNGDDGIHPNPKGYSVFVEEIYDDVETVVSQKREKNVSQED